MLDRMLVIVDRGFKSRDSTLNSFRIGSIDKYPLVNIYITGFLCPLKISFNGRANKFKSNRYDY